MNQTLIKLSEEHYIVVDDSPIQKGMIIYETDQNNINEAGSTYVENPNDFKITHSFGKKLDGVENRLLSELEEVIYSYSVKEMAKLHKVNISDDWSKASYIKGFNAHKELVKDKLFTIEDIKNAWELGSAWGDTCLQEAKIVQDNYIQSLLPKIEWAVTFDEQGKLKLI